MRTPCRRAVRQHLVDALVVDTDVDLRRLVAVQVRARDGSLVHAVGEGWRTILWLGPGAGKGVLDLGGRRCGRIECGDEE